MRKTHIGSLILAVIYGSGDIRLSLSGSGELGLLLNNPSSFLWLRRCLSSEGAGDARCCQAEVGLEGGRGGVTTAAGAGQETTWGATHIGVCSYRWSLNIMLMEEDVVSQCNISFRKSLGSCKMFI